MKRNLSSLEILVILHHNFRKLQFMRRILSVYIFSFIVAIGLNGCNSYDRHVAEILDEIARSGVDTSLSGIVSYEWDYRPESVIPFKDEGPMIIDFANDKRPIFDGDRSFNKLNKWVEELESFPWLSSTA